MERLLDALAADLARAVTSSPYLVGDGFTRADLTVASMLAGLIGLPGDELFALDESMRAMFGGLEEKDPLLGPLRAWRGGGHRPPPGRPGAPPPRGRRGGLHGRTTAP